MSDDFGFFSPAELVGNQKPERFAQCGKCGLYKKCMSPKMPPSGEGQRNVLIIGEAPGANEDQANRQFIGKAGDLLRGVLKRIGVNPDRDCTITNALICRPPNNKVADRRWVDYCRPNLLRTIEERAPVTIIPLGMTAVQSLMYHAYGNDIGSSLRRWIGWNIPSQKLNAWICPTWHPSYLDRNKDMPNGPALMLLFEQHLRRAFKNKGRPWKQVPDYRGSVELEYNVPVIIALLEDFSNIATPVAFDYETNRLKPEGEGAEIICVSVSNGKRTVAFPLYGEVVEALKKFLKSSTPKIAQNLKFEDRWSRRVLGVRVRNWAWDTMVNAHCLNNAESTKALDFQAFVRLGLPKYDYGVAKYLTTPKRSGGYVNNKIHKCDVATLLTYCGIDSLVEWKIAMIQYRLLNGKKWEW